MGDENVDGMLYVTSTFDCKTFVIYKMNRLAAVFVQFTAQNRRQVYCHKRDDKTVRLRFKVGSIAIKTF